MSIPSGRLKKKKTILTVLRNWPLLILQTVSATVTLNVNVGLNVFRRNVFRIPPLAR